MTEAHVDELFVNFQFKYLKSEGDILIYHFFQICLQLILRGDISSLVLVFFFSFHSFYTGIDRLDVLSTCHNTT